MYTEQEIINGCKAKDNFYRQIIFKSYSEQMLGTCMRYSTNIEEAKDIMHDGFIKIFLNIGKFKGNCSLTTWMTRIMINTAISYLRKKKAEAQSYDIDAMNLEIEDEESDLKDENTQNITDEEVLKLVQRLPEKYRIVINMYAIDRMSHKKIAKELNISEGTSRSQLSRARNMISFYLKERKKTTDAI